MSHPVQFHWSILVGLFVVAGLLGETGAFNVANNANSGPAGPISSDIESNASTYFTNDIFMGELGAVVSISVVVRNTSQSSFQIVSDDSTYNVTGIVTDGNEDGRVTLVFNTVSGTLTTSTSADSVLVSTNQTTGRVFTNRNYRLRVNAQESLTSISTNDDRTDTAKLQLTRDSQRMIGYVTVPRVATTLETSQDVRRAINAGNVQPRQRVTGEDVLVVRLDAFGIEGSIAATQGENLTSRTLTVLREQLAVTANATGQDTESPINLTPNTTRVVQGDGGIFLLVNASAILSDTAANATIRFSYQSNLSGQVGLNETLSTEYRTVDPAVTLTQVNVTDNGSILIRGNTTLGPGSMIRLVFLPESGSVPVKSVTVPIDQNGEFNTTLTLQVNKSDISSVNFSVRAYASGDFTIMDEARGAFDDVPPSPPSIGTSTTSASSPTEVYGNFGAEVGEGLAAGWDEISFFLLILFAALGIVAIITSLGVFALFLYGIYRVIIARR